MKRQFQSFKNQRFGESSILHQGLKGSMNEVCNQSFLISFNSACLRTTTFIGIVFKKGSKKKNWIVLKIGLWCERWFADLFPFRTLCCSESISPISIICLDNSFCHQGVVVLDSRSVALAACLLHLVPDNQPNHLGSLYFQHKWIRASPRVALDLIQKEFSILLLF